MMWLKLIRVEAGLSQVEVSKIVGISQQHYSTIESGKQGQTLPVPTAKRIADVLGFPWTYFYAEPKRLKAEGQVKLRENAYAG